MNEIGINTADIIILVIILLSGILSFQKGFIQEIMRISSWIGAVVVALYSYNPILPYVQKYVDMEIGASAITGASSFILSLVVFYIISHFISGIVKYSLIGSLNKSLGFIFGIIKGVVICSILYISIMYLYNGKKIDIFENAKTKNIIKYTSNIIILFLPENFENKVNGTVKIIKNNATNLEKFNETYNKLNQPKLKNDDIGDLIQDTIN